MDHDRFGRRVLDGNEDTEEMAAGLGFDRVHGALLDRSRASGREGPQGAREPYCGAFEMLVEQNYYTIPLRPHQAAEAKAHTISAAGHTDPETTGIILQRPRQCVAVLRWSIIGAERSQLDCLGFSRRRIRSHDTETPR